MGNDSQAGELRQQLEQQGHVVSQAADCARAFLLLNNGTGFGGVVLPWATDNPQARQDLLTRLARPDLAALPVVVHSAELEPGLSTWVGRRSASAMVTEQSLREVSRTLRQLSAPSKRPTSATALADVATHRLKVLLVDDSPTVRMAFDQLLSQYGFRVKTAASVRDGFELATSETFDICIVDYFMAEQNGVSLVRRLRARPESQDLALAMITGTYSDAVIRDALEAGATECIFKNEARELFLARVMTLAKSVLDRRVIDDERQRLASILQSVGDGVYGVNREGAIEFVNPAALAMLGLASEKGAIAQSAHRLFHGRYEDGDPLPLAQCYLSQCYRKGTQLDSWQTVFWRQDGSSVPVECTVYPLRIAGERNGSVVAFRDVAARKKLEEDLRWQATHDSLTKLPNRAWFEEDLESEIHRLRRERGNSALVLVDLDRFKYINDTAGHAAGDQLLIEIAQRMESRLRVTDSVARIGGDEYAIVLRNVRPDLVVETVESYRQALEQRPFHLAGKQYFVSATFGIALIDNKTISSSDVMANADIACHRAKAQGRNRVHLFSPEDDAKRTMDMELGWSSRLQDALRHDRFVLRFQPIVATSQIDFESLPTEADHLWRAGELTGAYGATDYEVLLRLADDQGELIAAEAFIPTAERFNMMVEIDRWVICQAMDALAALHQGGRACRFAINLSEQSLNDATIASFVREQLSQHGLSGHYLTFEISEARAVANISALTRLIAEFKALGCRVGLDDFGTGFASFNHLKELDVDYLKLDGNYLRGVINDPINSALLNAISKVAHVLGKETIAESVETLSIIKALQDSGVDRVQGYYIGRPCDEVEQLALGLAGPSTTGKVRPFRGVGSTRHH